MWQRIVSFFMAIIAFFSSLFGLNKNNNDKSIVYKNLTYGTEENQALDLYIPKNAGETCGLVFNIHGGAWIGGDKSECTDEILRYICEDLGFAAATVNYRFISDSVNVLDILDDIDAALAAIKKKGEENNTNINRVMLRGVSAGAHLSLLYGYKKARSAPMEISLIASYCAPTDLADENFYASSSTLGTPEFIRSLMSKACGYTFNEETFSSAIPFLKAASPVTYVSSSCPPTIIAHGEKDSIVPYSNAVTLNAALSAAGVKHDFVSYPNSDHSLSADSDCTSKFDALVESYIDAYLK